MRSGSTVLRAARHPARATEPERRRRQLECTEWVKSPSLNARGLSEPVEATTRKRVLAAHRSEARGSKARARARLPVTEPCRAPRCGCELSRVVVPCATAYRA